MIFYISFSYTYETRNQPGTETKAAGFLVNFDRIGTFDGAPSFPFLLSKASGIVQDANLPMGHPVVILGVSIVDESWQKAGIFPTFDYPEIVGEGDNI